MFTGIIEKTATITGLQKNGSGLTLRIKSGLSDVKAGESIAVNGVCLTVEKSDAKIKDQNLGFFVSTETLSKTNLGKLEPGISVVNLERAMPAQGRFSGHSVQGHIDGTGEITSIEDKNGSYELTVTLPDSLVRYIVDKGSIALDGISLTVNEINSNCIKLMIIPYTWQQTNLSSLQVGHYFNVETDIIAKYVEKLVMNKHVFYTQQLK